MKKNAPIEFAEACHIDAQLNTVGEYLHPSRMPLKQVDLSTPEDHGQLNMFGNECEGLCGV